ncbi:MAG TPA: sulfurtransferase [Steroidobacteraceae bacterium]|nr:sulfurtransferase [Steroidobacteraceae bacterium]
MPDVPFSTLIEPGELAALLDAAGAGSSPRAALAIVDCRHDLAHPEWGAQAYAAGHIPGASFAHLDRDLSEPVGPKTGRHPLPDPERLAQRLGRWGIDRSVQVVAYDQGSGAIAARLWWLLRFLGHERAAVLDGGFAAWQAAGLPVSSEEERPAVRHFEITPHPGLVATADEVARGLERGEIVLVDARAADRFAGRNETLDPVAGHVPGARNHPFLRNLGVDGRFLPAQELGRLWRETLDGASPERVIAMCGSGVTACHNLLAMERAGLSGARLYAGSWSEWCRDPTRPVAGP